MGNGRRGGELVIILLVLAGLLTSCGDEGPQSGPGTLTATVVSPNGAEGAVLLELFGPGIQSLTPLDGQLFQHTRGDTVRVAIFLDTPGTIRFTVQVADTTQKPRAVVMEVADGVNETRAVVSAYRVEGLR